MNRLLFAALAALLATPVLADVTVPASDSRITYIGRTLAEGVFCLITVFSF